MNQVCTAIIGFDCDSFLTAAVKSTELKLIIGVGFGFVFYKAYYVNDKKHQKRQDKHRCRAKHYHKAEQIIVERRDGCYADRRRSDKGKNGRQECSAQKAEGGKGQKREENRFDRSVPIS